MTVKSTTSTTVTQVEKDVKKDSRSSAESGTGSAGGKEEELLCPPSSPHPSSTEDKCSNSVIPMDKEDITISASSKAIVNGRSQSKKSDTTSRRRKKIKKKTRSGHFSHTDSSPNDSSSPPSAPDGGWGWVVVFSSFMIHLIADGVTYTFGIFYFELLQYFSSGKGLTAWIPSIMTGMTFAIGPVASGLTNKFGCRAITIAGSILAGIGLLLSVFAENIVTLIFTIGLCTGAGFGLIYLPAIVSVTCYFEKRRAFATGIAVAGSGIGSALFAPLTDFLITTFGWRGAMVIVSGLVLNCSVFGALFRPLEQKESKASSPPIYETTTDDDEEDGNLSDGNDRGIKMAIDDRISASPPVTNLNPSNDEGRPPPMTPQVTLSDEDDQSPVVLSKMPTFPVQPQMRVPPNAPVLHRPSLSFNPRRGIHAIKSDLNLKIMISDFDATSQSVNGLDGMQTAPVVLSSQRQEEVVKLSNIPGEQPLSVVLCPQEPPDSPTRHSFCAFKVNVTIPRPRKTSVGTRPTHMSPRPASSTAGKSGQQSHHHHHHRKRKTSGPSELPIGLLGRKDIFYSRSTLNLQQQFKSNPILYSASSATVSHDFRKSILAVERQKSRETQCSMRDDLRDEDNKVATSQQSLQREEQLESKKVKKNVSIDVEDIEDSDEDYIDEDYDGEDEDIGEDNEDDPSIASTSCHSSSSTSSKKSTTSCCPKEIVSTLKLMVDFKILSNPIFLLFAVSNFITSLGYYVPHIYLKDMAMDSLSPTNAVTESQASHLIGMIGIGSTVGRLLFGYLSDYPKINRLYLYNTCLTICGICIAATTISTTYYAIAAASITFGVFCGAYVSLTSVILVDLLGLEKLTNAFGILLLFQGVASFLGPPVIGWLYDATGSYDPGFNLAAALISISGLMLFIVPWLDRKIYERRYHQSSDNVEAYGIYEENDKYDHVDHGNVYSRQNGRRKRRQRGKLSRKSNKKEQLLTYPEEDGDDHAVTDVDTQNSLNNDDNNELTHMDIGRVSERKPSLANTRQTKHLSLDIV